MATTSAPDKTSSDYDLMSPHWQKVSDVLGGVETMRAGPYLPKFESETQAAYDRRLLNSVYTNIFADITENLSDRPFSEELELVEGSDRVRALCEDIDGQGNNLHNFAASFFRNAINYAIDWIYVDYTRTNPNVVDASGTVRRKSIAEEKASGARPYWVHVGAREMIAVYSIVINGVEDFVHCRMIERMKVRAGWDELEITQVRELNREIIFDDFGNPILLEPATFRIWRQQDTVVGTGRSARTKKNVWTVVDEGDIEIGVIPIVPLVIGERIGLSWVLKSSMQSCLDGQLEYYEEENGLKNIKKLTAFPMLSASNVEPARDQKDDIIPAPVGPRAVLYAPPTESGNGKWEFIEPSSTSLTFLRNELKEMEKQLRELGRQPLTISSEQLTRITSGQAATKGNSAVKQWALACKDALENALFLTALWLKDTVEPTVRIFTDFELDSETDDGFDNVKGMRESGDLSQETLWQEARRRNILSDEFDPEEERKRIEEEMPSDEELDAILPEEQTSPPPE